MKNINIFRVGITPTQPRFQEDIIIIIIIIIPETNKKIIRGGNKIGCSGDIPTLNMCMIFMNRKTLN